MAKMKDLPYVPLKPKRDPDTQPLTGGSSRAGYYDFSRDLMIALDGTFYHRRTNRIVDPQEICECGHVHDNPATDSCTNYLEDASGWCRCESFILQAKGWATGIEMRPSRWPVSRRVKMIPCPGCMKKIEERLYERHRLECTGVDVSKQPSTFSNKPGKGKPLSLDDLKKYMKEIEKGEMVYVITPLDAQGREVVSGTQSFAAVSRGRFSIEGQDRGEPLPPPGGVFMVPEDWNSGVDWATEPDRVFIMKNCEPEKPKPKPFVEPPRGRRIGPEE